jgi:putative endonuclease
MPVSPGYAVCATVSTEVVDVTKTSNGLGQRGEDAAVAYLERVGYEILERNWRCSAGEIDIVALDSSTIVLCEVKTRRSTAKGTPEDAVTASKRKRYERLAAAYVQMAGLDDAVLRFDVITILVISEDRALLRHHRCAFVAGEA